MVILIAVNETLLYPTEKKQEASYIIAKTVWDTKQPSTHVYPTGNAAERATWILATPFVCLLSQLRWSADMDDGLGRG